MAGGRPRRLQYKWDCWRSDRAQFERAVAAFDDIAVGHAFTTGEGGNDPRPPAQATGRERGRTGDRNGDWHSVLGDVDVEQLTAFTVMVPEPARARAGDLRLEFSDGDGVVLWAGPGYADTIRRVRDELHPALAPGFPKSSWWYSNVAEYVIAIVLGIVIELVWLVVSNHIGHPDLLDFLPLPLGILVAFGALRLVRPLFPRFRVRERAP